MIQAAKRHAFSDAESFAISDLVCACLLLIPKGALVESAVQSKLASFPFRRELRRTQNRRIGFVRPRSQLRMVLRLTPSFSHKSVWVKPNCKRRFNRSLPSSAPSIMKGGESYLMALIKSWQNGRTTPPFRQSSFYPV